MSNNRKMLTLFCMLALCAAILSCYQDRDTRFGAKTYRPGDDENCIASTRPTPDGGYIIAGEMTTVLEKNIVGTPTKFDQDVWVTKTDAQGNIQWEKAYGGAGWDGSLSKVTVVLVNDGGYCVFAMSEAYGLYWVLKLRSDGTVEWQKGYNAAEITYGLVADIQKTNDGGYILAGSAGIIKINAQGSIQWQKKYFDEIRDSFIRSMKQLPSGGFIVTGSVPQGVEMNINNIGIIDGFVMELDAEGAIVWAKQYGIPNYFAAFNCIEIREDGFLLAGHLDQNIDMGNTPRDGWIVKIDRSGSILWQKNCDSGENADSISWIENTSDNGFVVTGEIGNNIYLNRKNIFAMKFDVNGSLQWKEAYNFNMRTDASHEIHEDSLGYVICTRTDGTKSGLMIKVDKNGDAPGADFMKEANVTISQTTAQAQNCGISARAASFTARNTNAATRTTRAKVEKY